MGVVLGKMSILKSWALGIGSLLVRPCKIWGGQGRFLIKIEWVFLIKKKNPISTLPEHLHSTILRTPKLHENNHKPKETSFHPPSTLVPLLANYPHSHHSPPSLGGPTNTHPFLVIPSFGVPGVGCLLGRSLLCAFALPLWFQSYRCLSGLFLSRHSVIAFMLLLYTT